MEFICHKQQQRYDGNNVNPTVGWPSFDHATVATVTDRIAVSVMQHLLLAR